MTSAAIGSGTAHPRLVAAARWGGLCAGAWFAWTYAVEPKLASQTPASLIAEALFDVFFVWACCALISFLIHLATSLADFEDIILAAFRAGCDAVWFAPAILLLSAFSPAAIIVSLTLVVNTTRVLVARSMRRDYLQLGAAHSEGRAPFIIPELASPCFSWTCVPALLGAFFAQAGLVALWKGYPLLGAVFFAACAAVVTAFSIGAEAYQPKRQPDAPRTIWSIVATFILSTALCSGGLELTFSLSAPGAIPGGPLGNTRTALSRALHRTADPAPPAAASKATPAATRVYIPATGRAPAAGGVYTGVVLREKVTRAPAAILPMRVRHGVFGETLTHAMVIPFTGVYWLFRPPAPRPPPDATVREGTPLESAFSTTDGAPIRMEAHQVLSSPVDMRCCDKIKVDFTSAESAPGILCAGMILLNTAAGGVTPQSLALLESPLEAHHGTLEFPVPRPSALQQFNEIEVFFYSDWMGNDHSPKVGVDRFLLIPRGQ